jgi:uncharacterized pyridoxal phosphate-dependent enzyme
MIRLGGGRAVAVGWANGVTRAHLVSAVSPRTAAFLYVQSHHTVHEGMLPLTDCLAICRAHGIPCLVDAAAEEDLRAYIALGADAVTYSGGKAFGGPTSGFVAGRRDLIAACRAQERGIGRPMKVGKKSVVGLLTALQQYVTRDATTVAAEVARQHSIVEQIGGGLADLAGVTVEAIPDEAGRAIVRATIRLDPAAGGTARQLADALAAGEPAIYVRGHHAASGAIAIDPRPIDAADAAIIVERVRAAIGALARG